MSRKRSGAAEGGGNVVLAVPATLAYRALVTRTVATVCKMSTPRTGPAVRFTNELVSAVGEAFNNVVLHGYAGRPPGSVELCLHREADRVVVRIRDWGQSFDPAAASAPDLEKAQESGMGIFIIRSFVDVLSYEAGIPNVLTLTKRHPGR